MPWQNVTSFFVHGTPKPGGSKRGFYIKKLNRVVITDANKKTKPWMDSVASAATEAYKGEPVIEPVNLQTVFIFPRPKGHYGTGRNAGKLKASAPKYHTVKPDRTKVLRSTEDAMKGIVWRDDSQVVAGGTTKVYVRSRDSVQSKDEELTYPGVRVIVHKWVT